MRTASIPLLVFFSSILLVGFTFLPSHVSAPLANPDMTDGPLLFAYRLPAPAGIDRIAWWAWNPHKRSVWMASPEEGWAEVESNVILWSAQLEPIPSKAWQQLAGVVNMPGTLQISPKNIAHGTFLADLPSAVPNAPTPAPGEATATRPTSKLPMIVRCGWFDKPISARPANFDVYQDLLKNQGMTISNAITAEPFEKTITAVDAANPGVDRM